MPRDQGAVPVFLTKGRTDKREEKLRHSPLVPLLLIKDGIVRREETLRDLMFQRY